MDHSDILAGMDAADEYGGLPEIEYELAATRAQRDALLAILKAAPPHEYVIDTDGISYVNYVDADIYVWWSNSQRQAAIKMVEGEQGETA